MLNKAQFHAFGELRNDYKNLSVEQVLDMAEGLGGKRAKEVLDRLALKLQGKDKKNDFKDDRDIDMWATAITNAIDRIHGGDGASSYGSLLVKRTLGDSRVWKPIDDFMQHSTLNNLKVVERQAVYELLAELLVEHARSLARRSGAPFSLRLVSQHTRSIADVFDNAFPGYLEAGLAPVVARQLCHPR